MRTLRIAAPAQLRLDIPESAMTPIEQWWSLPEATQQAVVTILSRMIASGVVDDVESMEKTEVVSGLES